MLRFVAFIVPLSLCSLAWAGNQHCAVQLQSGLAVTPFAVPVASPVAVANVSPFVYGFSSAGSYSQQSYSAQSTVKAQSSEDALIERIAAKVAERLGLAPTAVKPAAVPEKPSLIRQSCVGCHGPTKQEGGLRLDLELTDAVRVDAMNRITHPDPAKRMPKGKTLDAGTLGYLLNEFTTRPKVSAAVVPEALPEPPKP